MTFDEYQAAAHETAIYPGSIGLAYVTLGLAGEAGEFANKVKKVYRDDIGVVSDEKRALLMMELGGCLWYLAEACTVLGIDLSMVADLNINQLRSRQERGKLGGSGDNR